MNQDYNTVRKPIVLKEYGRNVQKLVDYLMTIEDMEKRNKFAGILVELMKQVNPSTRDFSEESQKLWDDLFIISDFELEAEGPFPKPERQVLEKKPEPMKYKNRKTKFKHYGYNINLLVEKAMEMEDKEKQEEAVIYIGRLMRSFTNTWNRENVDESVILRNIEDLSNKKLTIDLEKVKQKNLFEPFYREKEKPRAKGRKMGGNNKRRKN